MRPFRNVPKVTHGAWHSPNTLPTMIHNVFPCYNLTPPNREGTSATWEDDVGGVLWTVTSTQRKFYW